jgi:hypothetical protein
MSPHVAFLHRDTPTHNTPLQWPCRGVGGRHCNGVWAVGQRAEVSVAPMAEGSTGKNSRHTSQCAGGCDSAAAGCCVVLVASCVRCVVLLAWWDPGLCLLWHAC